MEFYSTNFAADIFLPKMVAGLLSHPKRQFHPSENDRYSIYLYYENSIGQFTDKSASRITLHRKPFGAPAKTDDFITISKKNFNFEVIWLFPRYFQVKEEGITSLYKGITPVMIRAFVGNAVSKERKKYSSLTQSSE